MGQEDAPGQQKRRCGQDQEGQSARKPVHLRDKRRGQVFHPGQKPADPADFGGGARGGDKTAPGAPRHQRAGIGHRLPVAEGRVRGDRGKLFGNRNGFSGQDRLLQRQAVQRDQPQVGRHLIARFQQDHIPRHQRRRLDPGPPAIAQHGRMRGQHVADRRDRGFGPTLLQKADPGIGDHNGQDHPGIDPMPQHRRDRRGQDQHLHQHIAELRQETPHRPPPCRCGQAVRPEAHQPRRGLVSPQAVRRRPEGGKGLGGGQRMRGLPFAGSWQIGHAALPVTSRPEIRQSVRIQNCSDFVVSSRSPRSRQLNSAMTPGRGA
jgi:hypothetical protein